MCIPTFCRCTRLRAGDINWITAWHKRFNGAARVRSVAPLMPYPNQQTKHLELHRNPRLVCPRDISLFIRSTSTGDVHTILPTFPFSSDSPTFSLLSKCVDFDYTVYTKRDVEVEKTACSSFSDIGYSISGYSPDMSDNTRYFKNDPSWEYSVEINCGNKTTISRNLYVWLRDGITLYYLESKICRENIFNIFTYL